jgi:hypothetical protein
VATVLTADIANLFMIENSGFSVPTIIVHKTPNQTYATTNIAEVTNLKAAVAAVILFKMA